MLKATHVHWTLSVANLSSLRQTTLRSEVTAALTCLPIIWLLALPLLSRQYNTFQLRLVTQYNTFTQQAIPTQPRFFANPHIRSNDTITNHATCTYIHVIRNVRINNGAIFRYFRCRPK